MELCPPADGKGGAATEGLAYWELGLYAVGVALLLSEAATPGMGLAGLGGIACLLGCFLPPLLAGAVVWYVFPIVVVSCALLLLDSRLPGVGPLAWLGLIGLFAALFLAEQNAVELAVSLALTAALAVPAVCWTILRLPASKQMKDISLEETLRGNGLQAPPQDRAGARGRALSDLRPGGVILLDGQRLHATAREGFIERGSAVVVVRMQNGEAVVTQDREA